MARLRGVRRTRDDKSFLGKVEQWLHHWSTEITLLVLIVLSVVLLPLELMTDPTGWWHELIIITQDILTAVFVVELSLRYMVAPNKRRFFERYWLDILAVLPFVRALRLLRVLRVLRLLRAGVLLNRRMGTFTGRAAGTWIELVALGGATFVLVLVGSILLYLGESGESEFSSFSDTLWFSMFSIVAGEPIGVTPQTTTGRWITLGLMVGGLTVFGMFVGTVSASMVNQLSSGIRMHELEIDELTEHVLVFGWNASGPTLLKELFGNGIHSGRAVVLVTEADAMPEDIPIEGIRPELLYFQHGDYTRVDVLEQVNLHEASSAIILTDTTMPRTAQDRDARTVLAALTIERLAPHIYTVAELTSRQNEELLRMAGVEEIVVGDWFAGVIIGSASRNRGLIQVLDEILTGNRGNSFHSVLLPSELVGKTVREAHTHLLDTHHALLIAIEADEGGASVRTVNPDPTRVLCRGDRIVVLAKGNQVS